MKTRVQFVLATLALPLAVEAARAEITQECILEGRIEERRTAQLDHEVYLTFRSAKSGDAAPCNLSRRGKNRRIEFKVPSANDIADAPSGTTVKFRYMERENKQEWQLIERSDSI